MKCLPLITCVATLLFVGRLLASPLDDLASPDQAIRDKAAAGQRVVYREVPQSKWQPIIDTIKKGQTKTEVFALLQPFNSTSQGGFGGGGSYSESYRLDNDWMLTCWYENRGDILIDRKLNHSIKQVWVEPPKDFTGKWITYFVNGQKSDETNYQHGKFIGEFISYHDNGVRCVVQHYENGEAIGDDTGYHPSGHIAYRGQYKDGKRVGKWMWYDDEGHITSTNEESGVYEYHVNYSQPDITTPHGILFCDGTSLPMAFEQVITPLGEYVAVKNGGAGEWRSVEKRQPVASRTAVDASTEAFVAGSFEHPPKKIGTDWFYLVKRGLWVNPKRWYEVLSEAETGK